MPRGPNRRSEPVIFLIKKEQIEVEKGQEELLLYKTNRWELQKPGMLSYFIYERTLDKQCQISFSQRNLRNYFNITNQSAKIM